MIKQNLELCSTGGNRKWIYVHANSAFTPQGGRVLWVLDIDDEGLVPRRPLRRLPTKSIEKAVKKVVCKVARKSNKTVDNSTEVAEKAEKKRLKIRQGPAAERVDSPD